MDHNQQHNNSIVICLQSPSTKELALEYRDCITDLFVGGRDRRTHIVR